MSNLKHKTPLWADDPVLSGRGITFLDCPLHALTMEETLAFADQAMSEHRPLHHVAVNVAKLVTMRGNAELREDVVGADIISIDGTGILWGARLCGLDPPERVTGIDLMLNLFALCATRGFKPFLLGAEQAVLDKVVARLRRDYPALVVAGARNGYFRDEDEDAVVRAINDSGADCLFVAMPTPRKERFLKRNRARLTANFVMGVGGSFDVYSGKVSRAPDLIQRLGLEWLFRVSQEPRRLWRRYYQTNMAYAALLGQEIWRRMRRRAAQ